VSVEGTTTCPRPAEVEALVLPGAGDSSRGDRAELTVSGGQLRVRLLDRAGELVGEQELALDAPCASLAAAAAAVISAMELELHSSPPVDVATIQSPAKPTPSQAGTARTMPTAGLTPPVNYRVGAMFLGSIDGIAIAPGGAVTASLGARSSSFRLDAGLFLEGRRQLAFGGGTAGYQRFWVSLGPGYALKWRDFTFEGQLAALGGLVSLVGDGTTSPGSGTALEIGAALGLTAQWSFGAFAISTGPILSLWPGPIDVEIVALHQTRALPLWDGLWDVGLRFGSD
jgi:hypothetical protein